MAIMKSRTFYNKLELYARTCSYVRKRIIAEVRRSPIRYHVDRTRSPETPSEIIIGGGIRDQAWLEFQSDQSGNDKAEIAYLVHGPPATGL